MHGCRALGYQEAVFRVKADLESISGVVWFRLRGSFEAFPVQAGSETDQGCEAAHGACVRLGRSVGLVSRLGPAWLVGTFGGRRYHRVGFAFADRDAHCRFLDHGFR